MENSSNSEVADSKISIENEWRDRVLTLYNEKLITAAEESRIRYCLDFQCKGSKDKTELELFRVLMTKDLESSHRILDILKNDTADKISVVNDEFEVNANKNDQPLLSPSKNPLEIAVIIHCVLGFLPLKDIKTCRLVSKEINHVADTFLKNLSQISIGNPRKADIFKNSNDNFNNTFRFSQSEIPFKALQLKTFKDNSSPWKISALQEVFADWKNKLKELSIIKIDIFSDRDNSHSCFNMSGLLQELNITKLNVDQSLSNHRLQFSLETLLRIKHLRLKKCNLIINEEHRLAANYVEIKSCKLIFQNDTVEKTINAFVDLDIAKTVIFHGFEDTEKIKLDVNGKFQFDVLQMKNVTVLNWRTSKWIVDKIDLSGVCFEGISQMNVREMSIENSQFALCDIPETVEKLTCHIVECSLPVSLPNLKHLLIYGESIKFLEFFKHCPSLISLEMMGIPFYKIQANGIPPNLKKIHMIGVDTQLSGKETVNVETLVLERFSTDGLINPVRTIKAQRIVWLMRKHTRTSQFKALFNFISRLSAIKVAVGKFNWDQADFVKCALSEIVDKQSPYYLFENNRGTAISVEQFYKMMEC